MPKPPTARAELLEYLAEHGQHIDIPIATLAKDWPEWRTAHDLPPVAEGDGDRNFRQAIARLEAQGRVALTRAGRQITAIKLREMPKPGEAARLRRFESERSALSGRMTRASNDVAFDLPDLRTPMLNAYVAHRRAIEDALEAYERRGLKVVESRTRVDPLGEEAIALKERILRIEPELNAWRRLGAERGLALDHADIDRSDGVTTT
jgi:hypothetical protein